jgi:hypothetical protein
MYFAYISGVGALWSLLVAQCSGVDSLKLLN